MKTIAIVSTQLQFINAVEFVKKNGAEKNTLIIDTANKKRTEHIIPSFFIRQIFFSRNYFISFAIKSVISSPPKNTTFLGRTRS